MPKGTKVARHATGHRKVVPRGGTRDGITQLKGARARQQGCGRRQRRAKPKGMATGLRKTTRTSEREGSRENVGGTEGRGNKAAEDDGGARE